MRFRYHLIFGCLLLLLLLYGLRQQNMRPETVGLEESVHTQTWIKLQMQTSNSRNQNLATGQSLKPNVLPSPLAENSEQQFTSKYIFRDPVLNRQFTDPEKLAVSKLFVETLDQLTLLQIASVANVTRDGDILKFSIPELDGRAIEALRLSFKNGLKAVLGVDRSEEFLTQSLTIRAKYFLAFGQSPITAEIQSPTEAKTKYRVNFVVGDRAFSTESDELPLMRRKLFEAVNRVH